MKKNTRNKTKVILAFFMTTLCAWALTPLWVNPCGNTHLSEEEVKQFIEQYGSEFLTTEQLAKDTQHYREEKILCGTEDLPIYEKLEASNWGRGILSELGIYKPFILRIELVDTGKNRDTFYFKAYTFFYIPLFRAFAGGSGYMEITMWPFEVHEGDIGEWK